MRKLATAPAPLLILLGVVVAVLANVIIYAVGVAAGGSFVFTSSQGPARVNAVIVALFTALPLAIGLALTSIIGRWWTGVFAVAMVVAPVLEVGTILAMTVPSDHDLVAKLTLALCHLALVPVTLIVLTVLRRRRAARTAGVVG